MLSCKEYLGAGYALVAIDDLMESLEKELAGDVWMVAMLGEARGSLGRCVVELQKKAKKQIVRADVMGSTSLKRLVDDEAGS